MTDPNHLAAVCQGCNQPVCMRCLSLLDPAVDDVKTAANVYCDDCVPKETEAHGLPRERVEDMRRRRREAAPCRTFVVDEVTAERIAQRLANPRPPNAALRALFQPEILECRNGYNVSRPKPSGMVGEVAIVKVTDGMIDDWRELWSCAWGVVAYAIAFTARGGVCRCGCTIAECNYCVHECGPGDR